MKKSIKRKVNKGGYVVVKGERYYNSELIKLCGEDVIFVQEEQEAYLTYGLRRISLLKLV